MYHSRSVNLSSASDAGESTMDLDDYDNVIPIRSHEPKIFYHICMDTDCQETVKYDDEPYCFEHCPESGPTFPGYSFQAQIEQGSILD